MGTPRWFRVRVFANSRIAGLDIRHPQRPFRCSPHSRNRRAAWRYTRLQSGQLRLRRSEFRGDVRLIRCERQRAPIAADRLSGTLGSHERIKQVQKEYASKL